MPGTIIRAVTAEAFFVADFVVGLGVDRFVRDAMSSYDTSRVSERQNKADRVTSNLQPFDLLLAVLLKVRIRLGERLAAEEAIRCAEW